MTTKAKPPAPQYTQVFGEALGTLAPWADHTRIASGHLWWYIQPFLSIVVVQIFFLGAVFFMVAALSRKLTVVYLQGIAVLIVYFSLTAIFGATRSLEHFWSAILDPIGLQMVVMPSYEDQILPLAQLGKELRPDYLVLKHCSDNEDGDLGVEYDKYEALYEKVLMENKVMA